MGPLSVLLVLLVAICHPCAAAQNKKIIVIVMQDMDFNTAMADADFQKLTARVKEWYVSAGRDNC